MLYLASSPAHGQSNSDFETALRPGAVSKAIRANATVATGAAQAVGQWDGVTASAPISSTYQDTAQFNVPFGMISYYNQPWRGYMDTWPASQYTNLPGAVWNTDLRYAEPVCQLMQESGIKSIRMEEGWCNIGWDDDLTPTAKANFQALLTVFKKHGIRPLILLNAHHGLPCPTRNVNVTVTAAASAGSTTLKLASAAGIRPGYTGIQNPAYIAGYPFITSVDADGTAHLSSGLPLNVSPGPLTLVDLKYQPFQGTKLADGTPVPAAQETFNGWMKYIAAVATAARTALGTSGKADAGFDVEVWNELTFGSNFLDINNYYDNKFAFSAQYTYTKTRTATGLRPGAQTAFSAQGAFSILPMTVDYFSNTANGFPGVNVISGFSNQQPWDSGSSLWPGQAGFSRHYYTGDWVDVSPANQLSSSNWGTINALGKIDGQLDGKDWGSIVPGTDFVPTFRCSFPEYWHSGFKTESIARDVMPDSRNSGMPSYAGVHGRYTDNGDLHPAQVWQTETNYWRAPFFNQLQQQTGVGMGDARMQTLDQWMTGKVMLRQYVFHAHKGLTKIFNYCLGSDPGDFGMLPPALLSALDANGQVLTTQVRQSVPAGLKAMTWINNTMSTGQALATTCPLSVQNVVEYQPRLVFAGDGTAAHPNRYNRDEFAFLPFQLSANQYEIPYYVVSLDMTHVWNQSADPLDPARYDMPDQQFDVTIGNVQGTGATVSAYDPLKGTVVPVAVVSSTATTVTVRVSAVDYPRFLQVTEAKAAPLISQPTVTYAGKGLVKVSWKTNVPVKAVVTYGTDWTTRSTSTITVPASSALTGSVTIPNAKAGMLAVRIKVTAANNLNAAWPCWDQDPAGQIVIPSGS